MTWSACSDLPASFDIYTVALDENGLVVELDDMSHFVTFSDFVTYKVGYESDLYESMPRPLPGYAAYTNESAYIDEFRKACVADRRPPLLFHTVIFDFILVVEVLSKSLPKIEAPKK